MAHKPLLAALLALCTALAAAAGPRPHLECFGGVDISCSAYHQLATLTPGATCTGAPEPQCLTVLNSHQEYVDALGDWWLGADSRSFCDKAVLRATSRRVASAAAEVWSSAKSAVACEGQGEACGYTFDADHYAEAISESLAQAAAEVVVGGPAAESFCFADLRATAKVLAGGTQAADGMACKGGTGSLEEWKSSYVDAVAFGVEAALEAASLSACSVHESGRHLSTANVVSQCIASPEAGGVFALGNACGGIDPDIPECGGEAGETCCGQDEGLSHCECEGCGGPWVRKSSPGSAMRIYDDPKKHRCTCKFTDRCEGAPEYGCSAISKLVLVVTEGKCVGETTAKCKTVSKADDAYRESFKQWFSDEGKLCDSGMAEATAKAIGVAAASVYTEAVVNIDCTAPGNFACGWSQGNGKAWAIAFSESVAVAAARAHGPGNSNEGLCYSDIRALSSVIATVTETARAKACVEDQSANDYQKSVGEEIAKAVTNAFASATANSCSGEGKAEASSSCEGAAESKTESSLSKQGDKCAGLKKPKPCTGPGKDTCCSPSFAGAFCFCSGCENKPWTKITEGSKVAFKDSQGNICYCI